MKVEGEGDHVFWGKGGWKSRILDEGVLHTIILGRSTPRDARRLTEEACAHYFGGPYDRLLALWHESPDGVWICLLGMTPESRWRGEGEPMVPTWASRGRASQPDDRIPRTAYEHLLEAV